MTVAEIPVVRMDSATRAGAHMLASLLLDYPDDAWFARLPELRRHAVALPAGVGDELTGFIDAALSTDPLARQRDYVGTFDLKRKCSMYLSYYATGDTRRRGAALVAFLEAYRAAGWEFDAAELPDYLPAVLEFSARSGSPIAGALLAAHRDGIEVLRTALIRGAFDYQGQKCSAASRAFIPRSVWNLMGDDLLCAVDDLSYGDVTDLSNFGGAVIDERSFAKQVAAIERAKSAPGVTIGAGGGYDDSVGYFVRPTVLVSEDPTGQEFATEYFGPILAVHVFPDEQFEDILGVVDTGSAYALTGSIIAEDRYAVETASRALRFAAGNFYINDKPSGAVVGQQPFGGSRASGTNDKAGSSLNLLRWTSARSIKETLVPPRNHRYPHMGA